MKKYDKPDIKKENEVDEVLLVIRYKRKKCKNKR